MALKMHTNTIPPHRPGGPSQAHFGVFLAIVEGKRHPDSNPGSGGSGHHAEVTPEFPDLCFLTELGCRALQSVSRAGSVPDAHSFLGEGDRAFGGAGRELLGGLAS